MNKPILAAIGVAALVAGGAFGLARSGLASRKAAPVASPEPETHRVTTEMRIKTDARADQAAPRFDARGTDGQVYDLDRISADGPLVLLFIKDGCPCSVDAQRYFNRLHEAYRDRVRFLGVIDAGADRGRAWGRENRTTFPLLADPSLAIARAYGAESSAYAAVIARGGTIETLYPGYSEAMLAEVSDRLARLAGVPTRSIDASGAPEELSTGCPFPR